MLLLSSESVPKANADSILKMSIGSQITTVFILKAYLNAQHNSVKTLGITANQI
jgi:hypothetical protein